MPRINTLPKASELNGTEEMPIFQNGKTVRISVAGMLAVLSFSFEAIAGMDLSAKQDGDIIYYNEAEGKWLTKPLEMNVDGGVF